MSLTDEYHKIRIGLLICTIFFYSIALYEGLLLVIIGFHACGVGLNIVIPQANAKEVDELTQQESEQVMTLRTDRWFSSPKLWVTCLVLSLPLAYMLNGFSIWSDWFVFLRQFFRAATVVIIGALIYWEARLMIVTRRDNR